MEWMGKLCALALCGAMLALILKKHTPEYAFLTAAACSLLLLLAAAEKIGAAMDRVAALAAAFPAGDALLTPLYKAAGISVISRLSAALCRDAGQNALAEKVELLGVTACLLAALPLAEAVLELIGGML